MQNMLGNYSVLNNVIRGPTSSVRRSSADAKELQKLLWEDL
jgi:hypothetical protein